MFAFFMIQTRLENASFVVTSEVTHDETQPFNQSIKKCSSILLTTSKKKNCSYILGVGHRGRVLINQNGSHTKNCSLFLFLDSPKTSQVTTNLTHKNTLFATISTNLQESDLIYCDSSEIWLNLLRTTTKVYFPTSKSRVGIIPPNHQS